LLFITVSIVLMVIIIAEVLYHEDYKYTTFQNEIRDPGATRPPESVIFQPSATIFDLTMILAGVMILLSIYRLNPASRKNQ
jgi:hypothetical membrane protein